MEQSLRMVQTHEHDNRTIATDFTIVVEMLDDYYFDNTVLFYAHFQINGWSETSGLLTNSSLILSQSTVQQMVRVEKVYSPEKIYEGCPYRAELTPRHLQGLFEMTIKTECDIPDIALEFSTRPGD